MSEGELAAYVGDPTGELALVTESVATYSQGGSFGELALLYDAPRAATVTCTSPNGALLYKLSRIPFRNLVSTAVAASKAGLTARLKTVPLLARLSADQIQLLADATEPLSFTDGEYIEEYGAVADSLCARARAHTLHCTAGAPWLLTLSVRARCCCCCCCCCCLQLCDPVW